MRHTIAATAAALILAVHAPTAHALTVLIYARADRAMADRALQLAQVYDLALIDRQIRPGEPWRPAIAQALASADTVLVLWSARAARSIELGAEWRLALATGRRLVPILTDDTPLPSPLAELQAVDWRPAR